MLIITFRTKRNGDGIFPSSFLFVSSSIWYKIYKWTFCLFVLFGYYQPYESRVRLFSFTNSHCFHFFQQFFFSYFAIFVTYWTNFHSVFFPLKITNGNVGYPRSDKKAGMQRGGHRRYFLSCLKCLLKIVKIIHVPFDACVCVCPFFSYSFTCTKHTYYTVKLNGSFIGRA